MDTNTNPAGDSSPDSKASLELSPNSKSFLRKSVEAVAEYKPHELMLSDVISFTNDHTDKLAHLYFAEILQKASFGMCAVKMRDSVTNYWTRAVEAAEMVTPSVTSISRISSLATMLLAEQDVYAGEDVYFSFDKSINILAGSTEDPCSRGIGNISVGELISIVGELDLNVHSAETTSFSLMAPVVEALHSVSGVSLCGGTAPDILAFQKFEEWLGVWLKLHPLVDAYLDPPCVYAFDPVTGDAPVGIAATMTGLPVGGPHLAAAPVQHPIPGGALSPHIWVARDTADAKTIASHLRALHANPAGGGGAGPAMCVGRFSTGGVGFVWC